MQLANLSEAELIAGAGGDPWAVNDSLQAGSPYEISRLAGAFHDAGRCTEEAEHAFQFARSRFDAAWNHQNGDHPINDSAEVQRVVKSLGAQSLQLPKIGADLENIAAALAEAQKAGSQVIAALERQLQLLDKLIGAAKKDLDDPTLDAHSRSQLQSLINDAKADAVDETRDALNQVNSIRNGYSATLESALGNLRTDGFAPEDLEQADADPQIPPPNTKPEDVNRWWTSLTPEQRQRFIAEHPDKIGNLNGVPVLARSDANISVMNQDLSRVRDIANRSGVSVDDVLRDPGKYGLSDTDITRYHNADETKQGLDHDSDHGHNPVYLFAYDPTAFGGKGRAAVCIGNPDTAKNTAVIVPGTSSSVKGGWLHEGHNDALNLYGQANAADPNNPTAVIAWMGYDAPNDFKDLQRISTPMLARTGSEALTQDVNGLWATHLGGGQHVTVLGHSYGSTTVADAFAMHNMHANDAVLIGCPGTDMAHSAADFHLDGGHVYVGAASTDPISLIGESNGLSKSIFGGDIGGQWLGTDPGLGVDPAADGFGSVRFRAEVPGSDGINARHDHSQYYNLGGEALHSMADIASGHGDALQADGMTAGHRHQPGVQINIPGLGPVNVGPQTPAFVDPEWDRSPGSVTSDHYFDAEHHH
ncbi:alpha/beta hydrolase [Mycobacterium europaeum]|uniref:putative alpha/beta hydrolase n=1 Tax=Mycobacterium europaeum TaxID=761804 RepID=UPI002AE05272|nr:alpha/beta hydrolase [Mycobacterium europaeum]MEA1161788.1 alpha/beta hydrolase [Mycobacterium europaeum]